MPCDYRIAPYPRFRPHDIQRKEVTQAAERNGRRELFGPIQDQVRRIREVETGRSLPGGVTAPAAKTTFASSGLLGGRESDGAGQGGKCDSRVPRERVLGEVGQHVSGRGLADVRVKVDVCRGHQCRGRPRAQRRRGQQSSRATMPTGACDWKYIISFPFVPTREGYTPTARRVGKPTAKA